MNRWRQLVCVNYNRIICFVTQVEYPFIVHVKISVSVTNNDIVAERSFSLSPYAYNALESSALIRLLQSFIKQYPPRVTPPQ